MIDLLFSPVFMCDGFDNPPPPNFSTCEQYWESEANDMEQLSFKVTYGWLANIAAAIIGNVLLFYGFGKAAERMNRRVRDTAFGSLVRQGNYFFILFLCFWYMIVYFDDKYTTYPLLSSCQY
mmetsp:Transcript_22448/g.33619  ORF Transcript_22448/g.33619 Transcript_22448/m.33619 type:complete len:122 (+) Transcript_22448:780-1145(+)